jgi:hypothetical protein
MQPNFQHIVETRFSVRWKVSPPSFTHEWLAYRLGLLKRFCLPSVAAQTVDDITWVLFCDESTDSSAVSELRELKRDCPALRIAIVNSDRAVAIPEVVGSLVHPETEVLITTRLDSDDAIAETYLESIQAYAESFRRSGFDRLVLNFPRGYRLDLESGTAYRCRMPYSPFISLFERPRESHPIGALSGAHPKMHEFFPSHQDESMAGWLQVIHGANVSNAIERTDRELHDATELAAFNSKDTL